MRNIVGILFLHDVIMIREPLQPSVFNGYFKFMVSVNSGVIGIDVGYFNKKKKVRHINTGQVKQERQ